MTAIQQSRRQTFPVIWVLAALSLFSSVAAFSLSEAPQPQLPLTVLPARIDFGNIPQGHVSKAAFRLRNNSRTTIRVCRIIGSCSCTSHELSNPTIPAGGDVALKLEMNSGESRGKFAADAAIIYFIEETRQFQKAKCYLAARVLPNIELSPETIRFVHNKDSRQSITLMPGQRHSFEVPGATCSDPSLSATVSPGEANGEPSWIVDVDFDPVSWDPRVTRAQVVISVDDPTVPYLRVPVHLD